MMEIIIPGKTFLYWDGALLLSNHNNHQNFEKNESKDKLNHEYVIPDK